MLENLLRDHHKDCEEKFKKGNIICISNYITQEGEKVQIKTTYVFSSYKQDIENALEKIKQHPNPDPILKQELERILNQMQ